MEVEDVVHCLCITKPPCIQVLLDFILLYNCCDPVMTLEYVLVDILGSMNRDADLHIDMAFIAATEIVIIRDNPAIVNRIDLTPGRWQWAFNYHHDFARLVAHSTDPLLEIYHVIYFLFFFTELFRHFKWILSGQIFFIIHLFNLLMILL